MKKLIASFTAAALSFITFAADPLYKSPFTELLPDMAQIVSMDGYNPAGNNNSFIRSFHNAEFLYLQYVVADQQFQRQFLMNGLTLHLDLKGKKNKKTTIVFPAALQEMISENTFPANGTPDRRSGRERAPGPAINSLMDNIAFLPVVLKTGKNEKAIDKKTVSVQFIDEKVIYTVCIPWNILGGKPSKKGIFSVGLYCKVETGTPGRMQQGERPGGMGGMSPGGGSGPRMGGGGPGQGGGPRGAAGGLGSGPQSRPATFSQWIIFDIR